MNCCLMYRNLAGEIAQEFQKRQVDLSLMLIVEFFECFCLSIALRV
jgi:hypothetical protein